MGQERLKELIEQAKAKDRFKDLDFERFIASAPSQQELARILVVDLHASVPWQQRTKVKETVGHKRLQIGALIGKAATGGALAVANISLGVLGGLSVIPSVALTNIPIVGGLLTSAYTGLSAAFDAVEKIATTLQASQ